MMFLSTFNAIFLAVFVCTPLKTQANVLEQVMSRSYVFMDNSASQCGTTVEAVSGTIYSHANKALPTGQGNYDNNADCTVSLAATYDAYNFRIVPGALNLQDTDDCLRFSVIGGASNDHCGSGQGNSSVTVEDYSVASSEVDAILQTGASGEAAGFQFYFFTYTSPVNDACEGTDFHCAQDNMCLPEVLKCNAIAECSDGTDEDENHCNAIQLFFMGLDLWQVIVILASIAVTFIIVLTVCICCCCKKCGRKRHRIRKVKKISVRPVDY